jgi:hypothetical protein
MKLGPPINSSEGRGVGQGLSHAIYDVHPGLGLLSLKMAAPTRKGRQKSFMRTQLPDYDTKYPSHCGCAADGSFSKEEDLLEFARAIRASDAPDPELEFIVTSMGEWQPPSRRTATRKASARTADEGREGFSYRILRWPAFVPSTQRGFS